MNDYDLFEIDRIQAEIEKDLHKTMTPAIEHEPTPEQAIPLEETDFFPEEDFSVLPAVENFYRETIKLETPLFHVAPAASNRKPRSFGRMVAVVCIICTLGTASLGFGIGSAGAYARHHWLGGAGYSPSVAAESYSIIGTQYVFSDVSAIPREGTLSDVIKLVEPSVVNVTASFEASGRIGFGTHVSEGSGILFSEDHQRVYIATNHHVVGGASSVKVSISGSEPVQAHPVGSDPDADLQVISLYKRDLRDAGVNTVVLAVFGDSDAMEVGDVVLAIGNAMGEGNSATKGIVSAKERTITIDGRSLVMLQTDAAINHGNSGGPLINSVGEVIGINTAKFSSGGFMSPAVEGMSYSISSNIAKPIIEELMNRSSRPALGIYGQTVTDEIVHEIDYDIPPMGVFVVGVVRGSGAEKAGIQRTDILTGLNGRPVLTMDQLIEELQQCQVGDEVEIKLLRGGTDALTLTVTLGEMGIDTF